MKLLYRTGPFEDLDIEDAGSKGFDTSQIGIYDGSTIRTSSNFETLISARNADFDPNLNILVALSGDITERMDDHVAGTIKHQDYLSPGNDLYTELAATLGALDSGAYSSQIAGVRWNHEYRPTYWDYGSDWWTWASAQNPTLAAACDGGASDFEWSEVLVNVRSNAVPSRDWYFNYGKATLGSFGSSEYGDPKELYATYFVPYHCKLEASIINNLAATIVDINPDWVIVVYGAMIGPQTSGVRTVHGPSEYSCDWTLSDASNLIWEIGTWDASQSATADLAGHAQSAGERDFYFTMQMQGSQCPLGSVATYAKRRLDATNAAGAGPWQSSFGWWSDWRKASSTIGTAWVSEYIDNMATALNA